MFKDPLHNSLRSVIARARAVRCVVFLANSWAIDCKKTPCGPSRSAHHNLARVMQRVLNASRRHNRVYGAGASQPVSKRRLFPPGTQPSTETPVGEIFCVRFLLAFQSRGIAPKGLRSVRTPQENVRQLHHLPVAHKNLLHWLHPVLRPDVANSSSSQSCLQACHRLGPWHRALCA